MNNRIKQLIEQAEIKFESHPQHQGIDTAVIIPTELEKFAELIVRECANVAADQSAIRPEYRIRRHFGVEE